MSIPVCPLTSLIISWARACTRLESTFPAEEVTFVLGPGESRGVSLLFSELAKCAAALTSFLALELSLGPWY